MRPSVKSKGWFPSGTRQFASKENFGDGITPTTRHDLEVEQNEALPALANALCEQ